MKVIKKWRRAGTLAGCRQRLARAIRKSRSAWWSRPCRVRLDAFARIILTQVQARLKQAFIVDNTPGAGGNLGGRHGRQGPGRRLHAAVLAGHDVHRQSRVYEKMPSTSPRTSSVISVPVTYSQVLAVNPAIPANNLAEFVKSRRARN